MNTIARPHAQDPHRRADVVFGCDPLRIEDVAAIAHGGAAARLNPDPAYRRAIAAGAQFLCELLAEDGAIYGVTTGYGDSCTVRVPGLQVEELSLHLSRFHGCGMGAYLSPAMARGVLATRLASLAAGYSGVRWILLERLAELINRDVVPLIPEEGSVGASGDLTPLSYVAALLIGEREAYHRGRVRSAAEVHRELALEPLVLQPKDGLAIMNGTAVMTALACEAYLRAEYLSRLTTRLTALAIVALHGNLYHFDEMLFRVKPHPGPAEVAGWIREDLRVGSAPRNPGRLQDRYSIRCAPHVIGVLRDSLPWMRQFIEIELNSANDNPIVDAAGERILHGGHFYGGHVAAAMDNLKTSVANLADLMDRQLALLVDTKFSNGLPANLSLAAKDRAAINHGFKAVQIGVSAWTAEALKLTMPASVFSRSTECHNQDKVSMGTIAARDCLRVLQLVEQVAAAHLLAATQAVEIRRRGSDLDGYDLGNGLKAFLSAVLAEFPLVAEDRPLEAELRAFVSHIQKRRWPLYA